MYNPPEMISANIDSRLKSCVSRKLEIFLPYDMWLYFLSCLWVGGALFAVMYMQQYYLWGWHGRYNHATICFFRVMHPINLYNYINSLVGQNYSDLTSVIILLVKSKIELTDILLWIGEDGWSCFPVTWSGICSN